MTRKEAIRQTEQYNALRALGFCHNEAESLRRISMTLSRWFELECGTGEGQVSRSIERDGDTGDGKPFMRIQYPTAHGYFDNRYPVADRERGARKRLNRIIATRNDRENAIGATYQHPAGRVTAYVQGDPRGCALYILTAEQIGTYDVDAIYSRGLAVA